MTSLVSSLIKKAAELHPERHTHLVPSQFCIALCCRLLCAVVDNVEALVDEWFPGLRDIDILNGDELVQPMSLCPLCPSE